MVYLMPVDLITALAPLLDRVRAYVIADPNLRHEVSNFGRALAAWAEAPNGYIPASTLASGISNISGGAERTPTPWSLERSQDSAGGEESTSWMPQEPAIIAARCRVKADAARIMARRTRGELDDLGFHNASAEVRARAEKLLKCTLWMLDIQNLSKSPVVCN
jgi:hypothetical protein